MTEFVLVLAKSTNGVIGTADNRLPFHVPEDLAHLRRITMGHPVVMGRRTWDSLPRRPLPGRDNYVLTHNPNWSEPGAIPIHSLVSLIGVAEQVFVLGGAQVYREAMPYATFALVTEVKIESDGTVKAPGFGHDWRRVMTGGWMRSSSGLAYRFLALQRAARQG